MEGKSVDEQGSDKMWRCSACGAEFKPNPPDYSCPKCRSNATTSLGYRDRLEYAQRRVIEERQRKHEQEEPERRCPECGTTMRVGYLVERDPIIEAAVLGTEIYWSPDRSSEVALNAHVCPSCGKVSLYVRKLEANKSAILKAHTRKTTT
jgi:Zn finger protein HypA/HybF involved in hydrogenase expression